MHRMLSKQTAFNYQAAFTRNLGWVTEWEQARLRSKRIAIAGMGGVGGSHLLTLTRAGIGAFNIADFDTFEQANFNRQAGASLSHIGQAKVDVMAGMALDINPELDIKKFPDGINENNMEAFLEGVDLFIDGLDFFALEARQQIFALCATKKIPAITAAPLGMGAALLNFLPNHMTFEEYFRLARQSEPEQIIRFVMGLSPALLQMPYLADDTRVDFKQRKVPSTPMSCELCAGIAATEALKILLQRGEVKCAPHGFHFDAYRNELVSTWRPWGNRNPLQKLGLTILRRRFTKEMSAAVIHESTDVPAATAIDRILDLARWAPSGDNLQPWRFSIENENHFSITSQQNGNLNVYDLNGWANQLSLGTLLENIAIAASAEGLQATFKAQAIKAPGDLKVDVTLASTQTGKPNPLLPFIKARSTQRRKLETMPLSSQQRQRLEDAVRPSFHIRWFESFGDKWRLGRLIYQNAQIRLTIPEAYSVHNDIIEWNARFSQNRIPDQSIGLDPLTLRLMRSVMKSWQRVQFTSHFMGGTILSRLQLDLIPALKCSAQFILMADKVPVSLDDYLMAGRAIQRFWLTATQLGLQLQPQLAPLMFASYVRTNLRFTRKKSALAKAKRLARRLDRIVGPENIEKSLFMGRVGFGREPKARSLRKPLAQLYNTTN